MLATTLTQKGQATIPAEVRQELDLHPGDKVAFEKVGGRICLKKVEPFDYEYHKGLTGTLSEWDSKEDDEAYLDL